MTKIDSRRDVKQTIIKSINGGGVRSEKFNHCILSLSLILRTFIHSSVILFGQPYLSIYQYYL